GVVKNVRSAASRSVAGLKILDGSRRQLTAVYRYADETIPPAQAVA
ncbi:unnamed protein product, partial [marine sediment metagenome]